MKKIAEFYKVSFDEFERCYRAKVGSDHGTDKIRRIYDDIRLPVRATKGSAGYDLYSPIDIELKPGEEIVIPFGIRVRIDDGWVLQLFPRSGIGSRYRLQLNNTAGIIDADYFDADNEGHIMSTLTNASYDKERVLRVTAGTAVLQGIFLPFGITCDDDEHEKAIRKGGFGSTDRPEK